MHNRPSKLQSKHATFERYREQEQDPVRGQPFLHSGST